MNEQMKDYRDGLRRYNYLVGAIAGNTAAINTFKRILSGEQLLARERLIVAAHDGIDLMAQYRQRLADAERKIADARAELADFVTPPQPEPDVSPYVEPEPEWVSFGRRGKLRFFAVDSDRRLLISARIARDYDRLTSWLAHGVVYP